MEPVFVGDHPAMDFLNTRYAPQGERVDVIEDGRALLAWMVSAGLLTESAATRVRRRVSAEQLDAVARDARDLRGWADAWITRWSQEPRAGYAAETRRLNTVLHRGAWSRELRAVSGRFEVMEWARIDTTDNLLAVIAAQFASLVASEDPALIRRCAGSGCTLWFVDRTKGHRRLFCSASACGNRAKVAAFRARQRDHL